jgi:myosin-crossreactive antigen
VFNRFFSHFIGPSTFPLHFQAPLDSQRCATTKKEFTNTDYYYPNTPETASAQSTTSTAERPQSTKSMQIKTLQKKLPKQGQCNLIFFLLATV